MQDSELLDEQEVKRQDRLNYKWTRILGVLMAGVAFCIIPLVLAMSHEIYSEYYLIDKFEIIIFIYSSLLLLIINYFLFQISYAYLKLKSKDKNIIELELNRIYKKRNIVSLLFVLLIIIFIIHQLILT